MLLVVDSMMKTFDFIPEWIIAIATFSIIMLAVEIGYRVAKWRTRKTEDEKKAQVGTMVGSTLGLLAFILAFTFGMASSRWSERRQMVVDESVAIRTADLRASLLPQPQQSEIRQLLKEYVDLRIAAVQSEQESDVEKFIHSSEEIHAQLWTQVSDLAQLEEQPAAFTLLVRSLNEVIELHTRRMTAALGKRIPLTIWATLFLVAGLGLSAMGYQTGLTDNHRPLSIIPVVLCFALVFTLIVDLDRPGNSLMKVDQDALLDLQSSLSHPER